MQKVGGSNPPTPTIFFVSANLALTTKYLYFEDKINIVYGDIYKVLEIINNLNNFPRVGELVNPPDC